MSSLMNGAKMLLECLAREGVDCFFGYPGGVTLPFYDALYDHHIRHVLVRHEENACFAAEGYARATGKVGVCCATSGPGATNLVTGLVDAMMDSIPVVALTGQVTSKLIGSDAFQEADTFGITRSCTKHNYLVKSLEDLPQVVHEAFYIAASGRPGPVLVDIPKDVFQAQGHYAPVTDGIGTTHECIDVGRLTAVTIKLHQSSAQRCDPDFVVRRISKRGHVFVAEPRRSMTPKLPAMRIPATDAAFARANPHQAGRIFVKRLDHRVTQRVGVGAVVRVVREAASGTVQ